MSLVNDKRGVSEEFTSLPALTVVMIGFALFFALIAGVYHSYNERVESVDKYEAANFVLEKLTMTDGALADAGVTSEGGVIDAAKFGDLEGRGDKIKEGCGITGVEYGLKLEWEGHMIPCWLDNEGGNAVAASEQVAVYLNEAQTVPGVLTVIVWGT